MFSLIKRQSVLSVAATVMMLAFLALPQFARANDTATLLPTGSADYTSWSGDWTDINEGGSPSCSSSDSIIESTGTGDRESADISLATVPNGATIDSVTVIGYDRGDSVSGGTYQMFVDVDGVVFDSGVDIAADGGSGDPCSSEKTQNISLGLVKSGSTDLDIGVVKTGTNTNGVRVGVLRAIVHYTPVTWTITSTAGAGGSIDPLGATVIEQGNDQTYSSTPSAGYILSDVLVDAGSVGRLNSYTFSSVAANHTIEAVFEDGWTAPSSYSDGDTDVGDPTEAFTSNNLSTDLDNDGDEIDYGGFGGLGVPLNAISIDGIAVALEGSRESTRSLDVSLSWDGGSSWTSPVSFNFSTSERTFILGGSSDTWGRSWTPAEFDTAFFMVRLETDDDSGDINLDQLQVKVYYTGDVTPPNLAVVTPVPTPGENHQPDFTFSTDEDGTLVVGGGCISSATSATVGNNTIPFNFLNDGTYASCTVTVTDAYGNAGVLAVPEFTISGSAPVSNGGGGGGGNGLFTLVNNNSDLGTQPGSVLGAFTTGEGENQGSTQGEVLGASTTSLADSCNADKRLLTSNLGLGKNNPSSQVMLLQQFLNQNLGLSLAVSGTFGQGTFDAVKAFQSAHTADVLTPWGITDPTGYVGITTRRMIDILVCGADYAIPQLPN